MQPMIITAILAHAASDAYRPAHRFIGYVDYDIETRPANLSGRDLVTKQTAFYLDDRYDSQLPCYTQALRAADAVQRQQAWLQPLRRVAGVEYCEHRSRMEPALPGAGRHRKRRLAAGRGRLGGADPRPGLRGRDRHGGSRRRRAPTLCGQRITQFQHTGYSPGAGNQGLDHSQHRTPGPDRHAVASDVRDDDRRLGHNDAAVAEASRIAVCPAPPQQEE